MGQPASKADNTDTVIIEVRYSCRDTMPDTLAAKAEELGITVSQLSRRLISRAMATYEFGGSIEPATNLDELLVNSGVMRPRKLGAPGMDDLYQQTLKNKDL